MWDLVTWADTWRCICNVHPCATWFKKTPEWNDFCYFNSNTFLVSVSEGKCEKKRALEKYYHKASEL